VLDILDGYVSPKLFNATIFYDYILSPFVEYNRHYYNYKSEAVNDSVNMLYVHPKLKNTQLISGEFEVLKNGRITHFVIKGEYDMCRFLVEGDMGKNGLFTIFPERCKISAVLNITGNRIGVECTAYYGLNTPQYISDKYEMMAKIRPVSLTPAERKVVDEYLKEHPVNTVHADTANIKEKKKRKNIWNIIGDHMVTRIKTDLGAEKKGHLRIGPIFNPLYLGYARSKGVFYKFDIKGRYAFSANSDIDFRTRIGYSFKQNQMFYNIPVNYNFDKRHHGFIHIEFGNGNRITNSSILKEIKNENKDSIDWDRMELHYFRDMNLMLTAGYDLDKNKLSMETGIVVHRRSAVNKRGLSAIGKPIVYRSLAPYIQVRWQPWKQRGPIFTGQYERGIKDVAGSDVEYERMEYDAQIKMYMPCMRTFQIRGGLGFYTNRSKGDYFLDYYNFHQDYVPGGWNDEWTGSFEILRSEWYNASKYYIRGNMTYESPLLLLSYIPIVGSIVEKERIYVSTLAVQKLWPYMEVGYGFVNRVISAGAFSGFSRNRFEGFGVKIGFELFNNW